MKSKIFVSLLLAVLLLGILASPALASRPLKGDLAPVDGESLDAAGTFSIQYTHDGEIKLTVAIRGAEANATYDVIIWWIGGGSGSAAPGVVETSPNGRGRFSGITGLTNPDNSFQVVLRLGGVDRFASDVVAFP
jgi:hypothetical protein